MGPYNPAVEAMDPELVKHGILERAVEALFFRSSRF
jgi:hypothetical protein